MPKYGVNEPIAVADCPICQGEGVYHSNCDDTFRYDCKCTKLREIRQKIHHRIITLYPSNSHINYQHLLMSEKFSIDGWIGDCFPVILRELKLSDDYEFYRKLLFVD